MGELSGLAEWWLVHGEWELGGRVEQREIESLASYKRSWALSLLLDPEKSSCAGGDQARSSCLTVSESLKEPEHRWRHSECQSYSTVPAPIFSIIDWEMKKGNDLCHIPWWAMEKSDKNMDLWPPPRILRKSHPLSYHIHTNMHTFEALNLQSWERRLDFSSVAKQTSETVFTLREKYRSDASVFIKARR